MSDTKNTTKKKRAELCLLSQLSVLEQEKLKALHKDATEEKGDRMLIARVSGLQLRCMRPECILNSKIKPHAAMAMCGWCEDPTPICDGITCNGWNKECLMKGRSPFIPICQPCRMVYGICYFKAHQLWFCIKCHGFQAKCPKCLSLEVDAYRAMTTLPLKEVFKDMQAITSGYPSGSQTARTATRDA
jgi:hypothetical protein